MIDLLIALASVFAFLLLAILILGLASWYSVQKNIGLGTASIIGFITWILACYQWDFWIGTGSGILVFVLILLLTPKVKKPDPPVYKKPAYWLEEEPVLWREKSDLEKENLKGNVSSLRFVEYRVYEDDSRQRESEFVSTYNRFLGTKGRKHIYYRYAKGYESIAQYSSTKQRVDKEMPDGRYEIAYEDCYFPIEIYHFREGKIHNKELITYNENGRKIEVKRTSLFSDDFTSKDTFEWYENFLIEEVKTTLIEEIQINFKYDSNGRLAVQIETLKNREALETESFFQYDKSDNMIKRRTIHYSFPNQDEPMLEEVICTYDSNNNLVGRATYNEGQLIKSELIEYEYDDQKNWIKRKWATVGGDYDGVLFREAKQQIRYEETNPRMFEKEDAAWY
ncbi:MAG: hypothetical protein K9G46_00475 [Flavobacteriales bacterium]|nr:hypothetical protein [Flavobacteriales bacterium]